MAKKYKGSLSLEWFNKQKAIVNLNEDSIKSANDIPAPRINWINKEEALFYELNEEEGKGNTPYWVNRDDIRVKEARPLVFQKAFKAVVQDKEGTLPGTDTEFTVQEIDNEEDALDIENMLIKGDNLLALNTLKKHFDKLPDNEKVKLVYLDPPYNTGAAFDNYDDNLEHSEWLTLMRDRLSITKEIMSTKAVLFIQCDDKEQAYLKVLCDEVFGRDRFVKTIHVQMSIVQGQKVKAAKEGNIVKNGEYIHVYSMSGSNKIGVNSLYESTEYDTHYSIYIDKDYNESKITDYCLSINEVRKVLIDGGIIQDKGDKTKFTIKQLAQAYNQIIKFKNFINEISDSIARTDRMVAVEGISNSNLELNKTYKYTHSSGKEYLYGIDNNRALKQRFLLSEKVKRVDDYYSTIGLTRIRGDWWEGYHLDLGNVNKEGDVVFINGKKPERLIRDIIKFSTLEGDLILDYFGGSGTTFAVATKMKRRWIGIEIGNQADELIIKRLKKIMSNNDSGGITDLTNWQGGGSFKYYHLGESIISIDEETKKGEFNWSLGKQFIQESLLQSYDFVVQDINVFPAQIFQDEENKPTVGKIVGSSNKAVYGLSFLATPQESNLTITNEEVKTIYSTLKRQSDFQSLVIYSNKGIDIAQDTIPEDLAIIKVPHAIFSELER